MKFIFPEEDKSTTIKKYSNSGNNFQVEFMDDSVSNYYCPNPDEEIHRLNNEMLKAIALRKKESKTPELRMFRMLLAEMLMFFSTGAIVRDENEKFTALCILGVTIFGKLAIDEMLRRRELKKYDMLMEMYEHLDLINTQEYKDTIEFEHMYQKDLNLNTVDDFSLGEVRTLYKKFKKEN